MLVILTVALVSAQTLSYRITRTYQLGGDGKWDYVVPDLLNGVRQADLAEQPAADLGLADLPRHRSVESDVADVPPH